MAATTAATAATAMMLNTIVARSWPSDVFDDSLLRLIAVDWSLARPFVVAAKPEYRQFLVRRSPAAPVYMAADSDRRLRYAVAVAVAGGQRLRALAADPHGRVRRAASQRLLALMAA